MATYESIYQAVLALENELLSHDALHRALLDASQGQDVPWVIVLGDILDRIDVRMEEVSRLSREGLQQERGGESC